MTQFTYTIFRTDGTRESGSVEWQGNPSYKQMAALLEPIVEGGIEHVYVLHNGKRADMFVNETGHVRADGALPFNAQATLIYRAATMRRDPLTDPDSLPSIVGNAVLFDEIVWT